LLRPGIFVAVAGFNAICGILSKLSNIASQGLFDISKASIDLVPASATLALANPVATGRD
jgi:hypothetical protein